MWISNNTKIRLMILLMFLCCIYLCGCAGSRQVKLGQEYASEGDWDKSVQAFQEALVENPDDQEIQLMLLRAKKNASMAHLANGKALLDNKRYDEAITEFQMGIAFDSSNLQAESLLKKAKAMKESDYYLKMGRNLEKGQNYSQAKEAFQKAIELDPDNENAQSALARYKKIEEEPPPKYPLKIERKEPISLKFKNTPILNIFEVLTRLTGVNFIFDKDVKETKVTFFLSNVSFDEFMEIFLRTNELAATMVNEKTLLVYPDTPQKAKEYEDLQIRTFYLAHLDVKKASALLTKILNSKDISENEALNALVIRGPKETLEVAAKILEANDRPSSEVTFNVEILEVERIKEKQLGLDFPTTITGSLGEATTDFYTPGSDTAPAAGGASIPVLRRTSDENILVSIPTATLNLMKRDGDTKTLAKPQIRVKNRESAKIHIGDKIPLRTNRRMDTSGAVTYDYQYQDVGVKLNVEPIINLHDEITLKLTLEISSIGDNVGTADDPQYTIKTRTAESVMTVRAGESVIIGGLISDEERKTVRKVPLLGEIPVLGYVFSSYDTDDIQKDILMAITPIIIRNQEIPDVSIARIWSGKEEDFSLKGPYEEEVDQEINLLDRPREELSMEEEPPPWMGIDTMEDTPPMPDEEAEIFPPGIGPEEDFPEGPMDMPLDVIPEPEDEPALLPPPLDDEGPPVPQPGVTEADPQAVAKAEQLDETTESDALKRDTLADFWPNSLPYSIQVNAYIRKTDAEKRVNSLKQMEYDCFTYAGYVPMKDSTFYRVFIGKFKDYKTAKEFCEDLRQRGDFAKDIYVVNRSWAIGG